MPPIEFNPSTVHGAADPRHTPPEDDGEEGYGLQMLVIDTDVIDTDGIARPAQPTPISFSATILTCELQGLEPNPTDLAHNAFAITDEDPTGLTMMLIGNAITRTGEIVAFALRYNPDGDLTHYDWERQ